MRYLSRVVASVLVLVLVAVESQGTPASAAGTIALNKSFVDVSIETNLISVDIELVPGYNLVAIPLSFTTTTRARDIAVAALPGGVQLEDGPITAILRWDVSYTAWLSNQPDVNNFEIEATRGYFIRLQSRIPGDKLTLTGRRYGSTPPHPRVTSTSPLIISGSVIAHQSSTLTTVDRLSFQVSLALATTTPVDLSSSGTVVGYVDASQSIADLPYGSATSSATGEWNAIWVIGSGPQLDPGEAAIVSIGLQGLSPRLGVSTQFTVQVKPTGVPALVLTRKTPPELTTVVDLDADQTQGTLTLNSSVVAYTGASTASVDWVAFQVIAPDKFVSLHAAALTVGYFDEHQGVTNLPAIYPATSTQG